MDTDEILKSLTAVQRTELFEEIGSVTKKTAAAHKKTTGTLADVNFNIRLSGEIFLNVSLSMLYGDKDVLHPVIENIHQYETVDEYADAVKNKA